MAGYIGAKQYYEAHHVSNMRVPPERNNMIYTCRISEHVMRYFALHLFVICTEDFSYLAKKNQNNTFPPPLNFHKIVIHVVLIYKISKFMKSKKYLCVLIHLSCLHQQK